MQTVVLGAAGFAVGFAIGLAIAVASNKSIEKYFNKE